MSDFDKAEGLTAFAGQKVDTGIEAEAFSRYIGGHLVDVNEGATYSETSSESRAYAAEVGEDPTAAESAKMAELSGKVDTLFKGETLRGMLLNAYGWGTVGQITLWAGHRCGHRRALPRHIRQSRFPARSQGTQEIARDRSSREK